MRDELEKANTYLVFVLHTFEILQFSFKKSLDLGFKKLELHYWASISFRIYQSSTWKILKLPGQVTHIVSPWGEFHPWFEFAPVAGQNYLSVYMLNRGEISPLPLSRRCLQDRGETHPGGNSAWFYCITLNFISPRLNKLLLCRLGVTRV